jgi:hypothetical protein
LQEAALFFHYVHTESNYGSHALVLTSIGQRNDDDNNDNDNDNDNNNNNFSYS